MGLGEAFVEQLVSSDRRWGRCGRGTSCWREIRRFGPGGVMLGG